MAYIQKRKTGWRVQIERRGYRKSMVFPTKGQAQVWAANQENELFAQRLGAIPNKTVGELLDKYSREVSVTKRGVKWEQVRIGLIQRDALALVKLPDLDATHITAWRNRRLQAVSAASVRREWNLISHAFNIAIREWKWLRVNPMKEVARPKPPPARDRLPTAKELDALDLAFGRDYATAMGRVGAAWRFAIETGMRAGEICGLTWEAVDLKAKTALLPRTKNGSARTVPLSKAAIDILRALKTHDPIFGLNVQMLDALFRKAKARALIDGLHFHDSRAEAITRLAKKLDILDLARMVGHRDLRMLQVYYRESASEIAARL